MVPRRYGFVSMTFFTVWDAAANTLILFHEVQQQKITCMPARVESSKAENLHM